MYRYNIICISHFSGNFSKPITNPLKITFLLTHVSSVKKAISILSGFDNLALSFTANNALDFFHICAHSFKPIGAKKPNVFHYLCKK